MLAGLHGILLGRQAEGVVAHGVQHILALHAVIARYHIGGEIAQRMADMQALARRVGEHVHGEVRGPAIRIAAPAVLQVTADVGGPEGSPLIPDFLPFGFNVLGESRVIAECWLTGRCCFGVLLDVTHKP